MHRLGYRGPPKPGYKNPWDAIDRIEPSHFLDCDAHFEDIVERDICSGELDEIFGMLKMMKEFAVVMQDTIQHEYDREASAREDERSDRWNRKEKWDEEMGREKKGWWTAMAEDEARAQSGKESTDRLERQKKRLAKQGGRERKRWRNDEENLDN